MFQIKVENMPILDGILMLIFWFSIRFLESSKKPSFFDLFHSVWTLNIFCNLKKVIK